MEKVYQGYKCPECKREVASPYVPYCICEAKCVMERMDNHKEAHLMNTPLPKVIHVFDSTDLESYSVLLDNGEVWRTYILNKNSETEEVIWEKIPGPPCTRPKEEKDAD